MPLNPVVCGLQAVQKMEVTDPVAAALLLLMPVPLFQWAVANVKADATAGDVPLIAAGPAVTGTGGFSAGSDAPLKAALTGILGIADSQGQDKAGKITKHFAETLVKHGVMVPTTLVAFAGPPPPPTGPVAGTAKVLITKPFEFWKALELTDAPGIDKWTKFGEALKEHIEAFALITPTTMMNPAAGGPVTGQGILT